MGPDDGQPKALLREQGKAWVERAANARFLKDGSFLWPNERRAGTPVPIPRRRTLVGPLTSGPWEVRPLHGVDAPRLGLLLLRHRAQPHRRDV